MANLHRFHHQFVGCSASVATIASEAMHPTKLVTTVVDGVATGRCAKGPQVAFHDAPPAEEQGPQIAPGIEPPVQRLRSRADIDTEASRRATVANCTADRDAGA